MRYYIEDLSGRVERYDEALVSAIQQLVSRESVKMLRPGKKAFVIGSKEI